LILNYKEKEYSIICYQHTSI